MGDNENRNYVVKHNKLIEAKTKMDFTATEQKIFLTAVSKIRMSDKKLKRKYKINLHEYFEMNENKTIGGSQWELLEKAVNKLQEKKIKIERYDGDGFFITRLITGATFLKDTSELEIGFYEDLGPYLIALTEKFTKYRLKHVMKLKSTDSITLYELLKQYQFKGERIFKTEELRGYLQAVDSYKNFTNFKRRKITKSVESINENTDIDVEVEYIKTGRRVTEIKFLIESGPISDIEFVEQNLYSKERIENLKKDCGLEDKKISRKQLFEIYNIAIEKVENIEEIDVFEYIKVYVKIVEKNNPKSFTGYLKKALKEDFNDVISIIRYKSEIENK